MGVNINLPKVIDIAHHAPRNSMGTAMLETCKDRVFLAWLKGQPERRLAAVYERRREEIEHICRERAQERIWHPPATSKRAA